MDRLDIVVVCEARADLVTAGELADRVIVDDVDWIDPELLEHVRRWRGLTHNDAFIMWTQVDSLARKHRVPPRYGKFAGELPGIYARRARTVLLLIKLVTPSIGAVLLILDADDQAKERKHGLEQARGCSPLGAVPTIIGLPTSMRECWILAAFEPVDDAEQVRCEAMRQELGHDPRLYAERLSASDEGAKRSAKRVLRELGIDPDREVHCCRTAPLATLLERGTGSGLARYLGEVRTLLVPLLQGKPPT